jgi:hypothetical protein
MLLKRKKDHAKHWLCKRYYEGSKVKVMASKSTMSCSNHLGAEHNIYQPGKQPITSTATMMDGFVGHAHPLAVERWREDFIDWITHDDITFEKAASP